MESEELIHYWIESSDRDFETMQHLFEKKDYNWSLFVGHLVVEKLLKAFYVKRKNNHPPFLHNLLRLAELAELELSQEGKDLLDTISTFNIRARYDDYKSEFYKVCTKEFTKKWTNKIIGFREWIKKKL